MEIIEEELHRELHHLEREAAVCFKMTLPAVYTASSELGLSFLQHSQGADEMRIDRPPFSRLYCNTDDCL